MSPVSLNGDKTVNIKTWFVITIAILQLLIPIIVYFISIGSYKGKIETTLAYQEKIIAELKAVDKCHDDEIDSILQILGIHSTEIANLKEKIK